MISKQYNTAATSIFGREFGFITMEANYLVLYTNGKRASFSSKTQYHTVAVAKYIFFLFRKEFARKNMNSTNKTLSLLLFVLGTISAGKSWTFFISYLTCSITVRSMTPCYVFSWTCWNYTC